MAEEKAVSPVTSALTVEVPARDRPDRHRFAGRTRPPIPAALPDRCDRT
ncbi:hypothetical protein FTUN_4080 [Frigoriglobus tundricola]|uniref:Uncharacterized protein n=1 Tax=Frigoriglobus tundricola TaxID=2774151 RepID=A0A6M5YT76_9BACT|nr:hypothetical protein FTUN_4080 [Frigoriglobus tundricola]